MSGTPAPSKFARTDLPLSDDGQIMIATDLDDAFDTLFRQAIERFGPVRWLDGWKLAGIVYGSDHPRVAVASDEGRMVAILLSVSAASNRDAALYELAHEVVHCLHLGGKRPASMMEEGACVHFSLTAPTFSDPGFVERIRWDLTHPQAVHYGIARLWVEELLEADPAAIRKLREIEPDWRKITPELIWRVVPNLPVGAVLGLCEANDMHEFLRGEPAGAGQEIEE